MLTFRDLHQFQVEITVHLTGIRTAIDEMKAEARAHRMETYHQIRALQEKKQKPSTGLMGVFPFEIWLRIGIFITLMASGFGLAGSLKLIAF